jgi:DNA-binding NtrC family response regulator
MNLLLVDDEPYVLESLRRLLADEPYDIHTACGAEEGLALCTEHPMGVVVSDERMPGMSGTEFLSIVRERFPGVVRILLTGHASVESAMRAVNDGGIYRFLTKPWDDLELVLALRSAFDKYELEQQNRRLLAAVRTYLRTLRAIEHRHPGITTVHKDESGAFVLPEITDEELAAEIERCTTTDRQ